jgi:hypothetical protein
MSAQKDLTEHLCDQQQRASQVRALVQLMIAAEPGGHDLCEALGVTLEILDGMVENLDISVWQRLPVREEGAP